MLLPDCKCCSGFFAVICLLPFSLLLLPPLFPSCPAAVSVLPRRCFWRCSFCCFGWSCIVPVLLPLLFLSLFFLLPRLLLRCSRGSSRRFFVASFAELPVPSHAPCPALSRPVLSCPVLSCPVPGSPRSGHATRIGSYTKGRCKIALQRPRCRNVLVMPHPAGESCRDVNPGNPAGIVARKILRGACPAYFAWAPVIPAWFGCRGGQAWTSTGYGFGRKRVSAPYFPTGALRSRLFSKGILPAATVFCTRNCGGRNPASSW